MRKIIAASLALVAAGALSVSTASAYEDEGCPYRVHGVSYNDVLNMRAWPSPKSRIVAHIPPRGRGVELIRRKGGWGLVQYDGEQGWAHMGYLRRDCDY
jgi:uncharacterized protein YgiM (DUF1202 family)